MKYVGLYDNNKDIVTKEKLDAVEAAIPTKTSQLDNDSGFITSAPVTSVNTKTGAVTLSASDVGAQPTITVNGIIKGDGAGNLSAQDTVAAELVDLPTVPTKVSELTNDANYITAAQAPVQSVNNKTGAVSLTASDVSAIPSTLTGTAGQVLTKTADGQEWKDAASPDLSNYIKLNTSENQVGYRPSGELQLYFGGNTPEESPNSIQFNSDNLVLGNNGVAPETYLAAFSNNGFVSFFNNYRDTSGNERVGSSLKVSVGMDTTLLSEGAIEVGLMKQGTINDDYSLGTPITTDTQASNIRAGLVLEPKSDTRTIMTLVNNDAGAYLQFDPANEAILFSKTQPVTVRSEQDSAGIVGYSGAVVRSSNGSVTLDGTQVDVSSKRIVNVATPTSATDAANKTYVDELSKPKATKTTLTVEDWDSTDKYQTVAMSGFGITNDATKQEIRVMPVDAAIDSAYISNGVQCIGQGDNLLRFGCDTIPTEAIEVYVVVQTVNFQS